MAFDIERVKAGRVKIYLSIAVCVLLTAIAVVITLSGGVEIHLSSPSCVVMDADTGEVLFEKSKDTRLHPASLTKLVAVHLIFEAIENGELDYNDMIPVSEHAVTVPASKAGLRVGEPQSVPAMLDCIMLPSGSDAVVAMGEYLYGSESALVTAMNGKLNGFGLKNTSFTNCMGISASGHMSTAEDMAVIAKDLITNYPDVLKHSSKHTALLRHEDGTETLLVNTNRLILNEGVTGLKTGTGEYYNTVVTYSGENRSLIIVLMGAGSEDERVDDATKLIEAYK